jgi:PhnB protein
MSQTKVKPIPDGMTAITPHLVCANASAAIEFYKKAFNAVEESRLAGSGIKEVTPEQIGQVMAEMK